MNQVKRFDSLWVLAGVVVVVLFVSSAAAASSSHLAGASLSLESELQQAMWDGWAFDLLFGLAVGASVAAVIRAYQIFATPRRTAS